MKAIEAGSLGGCFVQMDIGSKERSALKNLQIPVGSTDRTVPEWLFPRQFPSEQRLTTSRPDAILVTEMPTKKAQSFNPDKFFHNCSFSRRLRRFVRVRYRMVRSIWCMQNHR